MSCFICGSTVEKIPVKDLIYCHTCEILRRSEILSRDELKEDGKDFLLSACRNPVTRASRMNDAKGQLDVLEKYISPGKLYDIGAAGGFFMKAAKDRGWEVSGNELSSAGVKWAKDNLDLDIFCGFLEDDILPENHFDAIVMWNTLEHLDYPLEALKQCYKSLNDDGYVFIKVPCKGIDDIEDVRARYEYLHLTEFSRDGLVKMLSKSGFSVELETYDNDCGRHIMVLAKKQNTLMEKFNELIEMMSQKIPFCLARFNDGEMMGVNSDNVVVARGDQYVDKSLQNALKEALAYRDINYWIGLPCENCWPEHRKLADTLVEKKYPYRTSAVVLTNENWQRAQKEIIEKIGDRPVWIISGQGQNWDSFNLNIERHIKVPEKDAWASRGDVVDVWKDASPGTVVLISCGPLSRILAYEWWKNRQDCTVIDVGSTFDPFTRGVSHKCHKWSNGKNETNWCPSCNSAGHNKVSAQKKVKRLVIGYPHGLGDCILATPALRERKLKTGEHITFAMLERFKSSKLFDANPYIDEIIWLPDPWNDFENPNIGFSKVRNICEEISCDEMIFVPNGNFGSKLLDMMRRLGVEDSENKHTDIYLTEDDEREASMIKPKESYGFIHSSSPSLPSKDFPTGYANKWVAREGLDKYIEVDVDFNATDYSIGVQFILMRDAAKVALIDSVFYHACCAMNKKVDLVYFKRGRSVHERVRHAHEIDENVIYQL